MKKRTESTTHLILESLNNRMTLSFEDKMNYQNQVKGFEGECLFDQYLNHLEQPGIVINDLLLSTKNTSYQIDSLLLLNQQISIYEVKNYTGSYTYKDGTLFSESGHAIQDPLGQVNRKKSYLHNLLLNKGYTYSISACVVYADSDFYIYSLPQTKSILFHGQLENHFNQLLRKTGAHPVNREDKKLATHLVSLHNENYRPNHLPSYSFQDLKKGITCPKCFSFQFSRTGEKRKCDSCGFKEKIADAIYRSVLEFRLLFPEMKISVPTIRLWCGSVYNAYHVRSVLTKNFTRHSKGSKTFYT